MQLAYFEELRAVKVRVRRPIAWSNHLPESESRAGFRLLKDSPKELT